MSVKKPYVPDSEQQSDENKFGILKDKYSDLVTQLKRLERTGHPGDQAHAAEVEQLKVQIKNTDQEILILVDKHLRQAARPALLKMFGPIVGRKADATVRYTNMVNEFFAKVLAMKDDEKWKMETARQLRSYASVVMSNQIRDHLRRKKLAPQAIDSDVLASFADQRQVHFEKHNHVPFEAALKTLERWSQGTDADLTTMAQVLRHRYIDGMPYDKIAEQLDLKKEVLYRIAEEAKKRLRAESK